MKTPVLFMSRNKLRQNYQTIRQAMPNVKAAYAIKSNSHPEIIHLLQKENAYFETASLTEIKLLLSFGVSPEHILFSNPVKPVEAVQEAVQLGVLRTTIDSLEEAEKLLPFKNKLRLYLRLIVSNEGSLWPLVGKFGLGKNLWPNMFSFLREHQVKLEGIAFHVGSQCQSPQTWKNALQTVWTALQIAKEYNLNPQSLNIGGGFPIELAQQIPAIDEIAAVLNQELARWQEQGYSPQEIFAEPGRFISGSAGWLVAKVIGIAERDLKGNRTKWVYLDVGVFNGMMETIDGFEYPIYSSGSGAYEKVLLCGPSCDSVDKMFEVFLPTPKVNDILIFVGAGAYTTVYASNFNGFAMPQTEFVDSWEEQLAFLKSSLKLSFTISKPAH